MPNDEFSIDFSSLPSGTKIPGTMQELGNMLARYMTVRFNEPLSLFNYGSETPSVDQQDRPWFRFDSLTGKPMGWYAYVNGAWTISTQTQVGTIITVDPAINLNLAMSGLAQTADWAGWALCNGSNGTPDLRNRMINGAGGDYNTTDTGGEETHTLSQAEVGGPFTIDIIKFGFTRGTGGQYINDARDPQPGKFTDPIQEATSNAIDAHNNMPPYYALYYLMFIGT